MARGKAERGAGRPSRRPSGQDGLFEKAREEAAEAARGRPVECLGLTFENDAARRAHFLGDLRKGLEELHATLGGVPFSGIDDATARMAAVAHWPMGDEAHLRGLAERMARADRSKDLLQRWKDEVGFPHGEIDDVLALSDPPWHTACPNPFLGAFVEAHGRPHDPAEPYRRKPFAVDVSEGKTHPVYRAHGYHTKVPHLAIVPSILHYTEPGDLVLDGFAGSGMTGVAAQWCGTAPETWRIELEAQWSEEGFGKPRWGTRRAILNDLAPAAGFIAANYTLPFDVAAFADAGRALLDEVEEELGWMYETLHTDGKTKGRIDYTVWSEVFSCPECAREIVFLEEALDRASGRVSDVFACPECDSLLNKNNLERVFRSDMDAGTGQLRKHVTFRPALIRYRVDGRTYTKRPDDGDRDVIRRIEETPLSMEVPTKRIPVESMYHGSRLAPKGITHTHHFFLPRAAHALAAMWRRADAHRDPRIRHMLLYFVEQAVWGMSILNRYGPTHYSQVNRQLTGVYYVASQIAEVSPWYNLGNKLSRLVKAFREFLGKPVIPRHPRDPSAVIPAKAGIHFNQRPLDSRFRGNDELHGLREDDGLRGNDGLHGDDGPRGNDGLRGDDGLNRDSGCITTTGTTASLGLPDDSVDYVFTDPPFGENIYYADLNFLVESWHRVLTNAAPEAIVDRFKGKGLPEYQRLMQRCFEEYRRVLKPGRWITIVFHNSRNAVWTAIQEALLAAGFVVADVRTMDKRQGSYRQVTSTAVKQDLVISAYKPNGGLEARFALGKGAEEGAWDFVRTHLGQLPVFVRKGGRVEVVNERQPHLLFDRMVAFHVLRNVTVPLSIGEFLSGLTRRFPERDGMVFLPDQVAEYDGKRAAVEDVAQLEIFVVDEVSAIQWLKRHLSRKPQSFQDVHPQFLREIAGWRKHERLPELSEMLEQNFLHYDGAGEVPSQVHAYLSTNFKELRKLPKDHPALRAKGKDRWYVPDPNKAVDVEKRRTRILLREFEQYRQSSRRKLRSFRLEAMRAGFFKAYQDQDYATILSVAERIPEAVLQEDQKLLLWYDQALTRSTDPGGHPPGRSEAPALVRSGVDALRGRNMTITRLKLERFTAFDALDLKPSPGINVLVGANGTGKTHLMKVAYAACDVNKTGAGFAEKLIRVFMPSGGAIGRLVKRRGAGSSCEVHIHRGDRRLQLSFSTRTKEAASANTKGAPGWISARVRSVYIPAKEMLANAPGFLSLHAQREIHFEDIYPDILNRAYLPELRDPSPSEKRLLTLLQRELGGKIRIDNEEFFLRSRGMDLEFPLVAEGIRRIGLLWLLIRNGVLSEGSVLFWDEPEANLNPKLFRVAVEVLLELQRLGVQVFIATHDYAILKELDLQRRKEDDLVFHSLYRDDGEIACHSVGTYLDIHPNAIAEAFTDLYDREVERSLGASEQ